MSWFRRKKSGIKALSIAPPSPRPDRYGIAIAACVKNEEAYIEEWLRFHLGVGIRHFILYDHGSTDGTVEAIRRVLTPETLTLVPWAGRVVAAKEDLLIDGQVLAFAHAIQNFGGSFRRMAFIDADEFLLPRTGATIEEALAATNGFPNVSLPWHMFGTGGHRTKPEGSVTLNYTMRSADPLSPLKHATNFKCIIDPCEVVEVSVHQFRTREHDETSCNDAGQKATRDGRKAEKFYSNAFLQLNHYYSKSEEEFSAKLARGAIYALTRDHVTERMTTTLRNIQLHQIEDRAMVEFIERMGMALDER